MNLLLDANVILDRALKRPGTRRWMNSFRWQRVINSLSAGSLCMPLRGT